MSPIILNGFVWVIVADPSPAATDQLLAAIRTAYESNRAALPRHGLIRYHESDGQPTRNAPIDPDALPDIGREPRSTVTGLYVFDGDRRRFDHVYSLDDLVARRERIGENRWMSPISSWRRLTDGQTTLIDELGVIDGENETLLRHNPYLISGKNEFFKHLQFPLALGNPDPGDAQPDLGMDLARALEGGGEWHVAAVEENATIRGIPVLKLTFARDNGETQEYWVDLEHGAIPLRIRWVSHDEKFNSGLQYDYSDIRQVGDQAWLPYRMSVSPLDDFTSDGRVRQVSIREVVIDEAELSAHPDPSLFRMEFPEPVPLINITTKVRHDPRQMWDLNAISPAASAFARPLNMAPPASSFPPMPGQREAVSPWRMVLIVVGVLLLTTGCLVAYRRWRHA